MRTLIISDLHLGGLNGTDLLRWPAVRAVLCQALDDVDRLVLLGDVLELRHGPARDAIAAARPFFAEVGEALGSEGELVLVAGNHDHGLVEPWLARRGETAVPEPLAVEQLLDAQDASAAYAQLADWAQPARVRVAYPGLWLRDDVYAMHGHYLDSHLTIPTLERLSVGAMSRLLSSPPETYTRVDDYEAVGAPVFAWRDAVARDAHTGAMLNGLATVDAWRALGGAGGDGRPTAAGATTTADAANSVGAVRAAGAEKTADAANTGRANAAGAARAAGADRRGRDLPGAMRPGRLLRRLRRRALVAGFPVAVAALNRAGLGPLRAEISGSELRRAGLQAMGEVAARLGLGDAYVVFGHTHRPGPLDGDDAGEWRGRGGARLLNTGSWTYSSVFLGAGPAESPYWPGAAVLVPETGEPRVLRLLQDFGRDHLAQLKAHTPAVDLSTG